MNITRVERLEMNELSKEVFGVSSRWQKFLNGVLEPVTRTVNETVPGVDGAEPTTKEAQVPVLVGKTKVSKMRYYSVEEIKTKMLEFKAKKAEIDAIVKQQQAEQKAKQEQEDLQKKIQEDLSGSAVV